MTSWLIQKKSEGFLVDMTSLT